MWRRHLIGLVALQAAFTCSILAAVHVSGDTLVNGTVGVPYSETVTAQGGSGPYRWTLAGGPLPPGLALSQSGQISGTPSKQGTFNFTLQVADAHDKTDSGDYTILISAAAAPPNLSVTTTSLAPGTANAAYSASLAAAGGTAPYAWSISAGALPAGLSLSGSGQISGTPTAAGTSNFTARVTDSASRTAAQALSITINAAALNITTASLANGAVGAAYSASLAATGGTAPYAWSVSADALPAGLSLSGSGQISGTPTMAGTSNFTARVTDSASHVDTQALSITINAAPLNITNASLANGAVGAAYSASLAATGGTAPYAWSISAGALPTGLSFSGSGQISGTPTTAGTGNFTVRVTDSASRTATQALSITINAAALNITTASLANGAVGAAYSASLAATGGTAPYAWSLSAGALPTGLSLSGSGQISGTPATAGTSNFTVRASDSASQVDTQALSLTINAAALTINTGSLPGGATGVAYSVSLSATGGAPPYSWSIAAGSLPAGLTLSGGGQISGTPAAAGSSNFTVQVKDSVNASATQALSIAIAAGLTAATCPAATADAGQPYNSAASATGGTPPYTWSLAGGQLPAGLTLSATSGAVTGTPATPGVSSFTLRVADASSSASKQCGINVAAPVSISTTALSSGVQNTSYSQALAAAGGTPPYAWSIVAGTLPAGLTLGGSGQIGGTPSAAGTASFTVQAADANGRTATQALTLAVTSGLAIGTCPAASAIAGQGYSSSLTASGGQAPYTWSISAGQLPAGLSLSSAGAVSGTPSQAGTFSFTARVADASSSTSTKPCSIAVSPSLAISTSSMIAGGVGAPYLQQLSATGGAPPYSWSISTGSLPPGLSLNSSTAQISGTASAAGTFPFTLHVSDSAGASAEKNLSINIVIGLALTACPGPAAVAGKPYASAAAAAGGQAPYAWSVASGVLPAGLSLDGSSGLISGTPSAAGNSDFSLAVFDRVGASARASCSIVVASQLSIANAPLPDATVRTAYSFTVRAIGGSAPYTWTTSAGSLPPGLALSAAGVISGTPSTAGSFAFVLHADDGSGASAELQTSITVAAGLTIPACPAPVVSAGSAYLADLLAIGGSSPYTWSINTGSLPAGLALNASSARISGTPVQTGAANFTLHVYDAGGRAADRPCSINVTAALVISSAQLPDAVVGSPYAQTLVAAGGTPPYAWSTAAGSLPPGLFLNAAAGQLTGTPTAGGPYQFTVKVNDSAGAESTLVLSLNVARGLVIADCPVPVGAVGQTYSATLSAPGGRAPLIWSITAGALPSGLGLDLNAGIIAGIPDKAGLANYTLGVVDAAGGAASRACIISIGGGGIAITTPASLAPAVLGVPYSADLAVSGGSGSYAWSLSSGVLPDGIVLDPAGHLAGTPSQPGTFQFTLQAVDGAGSSTVQTFTASVLLAAAPAVALTGLTDFVQPAQQPIFDMALGSSYPVALSGTVTLSFSPDAGINVDDPAIRFSNGARSMKFTVPAGSTSVSFAAPVAALQTGTVAGAIQLDVAMEANGTDLGALDGGRRTVRVDRLAPRITSLQGRRTSSGVELTITGYVTTRELSQAGFRFMPANGGSPVEVAVPLNDAAVTWFKDSTSWKFGGEFRFVVPFTIPNANSFGSVVVTLTGAQGTSAAATVSF